MTSSVDVIYPTVNTDDVSVKLSKSVSNFLFTGFGIIGRAPVAVVEEGRELQGCGVEAIKGGKSTAESVRRLVYDGKCATNWMCAVCLLIGCG
jgi:hypothetical protein